MPISPTKSIIVAYMLAAGLFTYLLGFVFSSATNQGGGSKNQNVVIAVNDAVAGRRNELLVQSATRQALLARQLELQQAIFRQQATQKDQPTFTVPAPTITPTPAPTPAPVYVPVKPRTTLS